MSIILHFIIVNFSLNALAKQFNKLFCVTKTTSHKKSVMFFHAGNFCLFQETKQQQKKNIKKNEIRALQGIMILIFIIITFIILDDIFFFLFLFIALLPHRSY